METNIRQKAILNPGKNRLEECTEPQGNFIECVTQQGGEGQGGSHFLTLGIGVGKTAISHDREGSILGDIIH